MRKAPNLTQANIHRLSHAHGAIKEAKSALEHGLITKLRVLIAGAVLGDLLSIAKEALGARTQEQDRVAAVMVAAGFEDLIRRMGAELASVTGRPKLEEVIVTQKNANVLKGGQVSTAVGDLPFRNDALHADWNRIDRSQVQSCLAFVEELLSKHFS